MTTDELRRRRAALLARVEALANLEGDLNKAERADWAAATAELDQVDAQLTERAERAKGLTGRAAVAETGDGAAGAGAWRDRNVNRAADRGALLERAEHAGGVNTREGGQLLGDAARAAIDAWSSRSDVPAEYQESAEKVVTGGDRHSRQVAEYVAACSTPEYEQAWRQCMIGGPASLMGDDALEMRRVNRFISERAMNEGSVSAGQAAVPAMLDPAIILNNTGTTNPFRTMATVKTITTQTWRGITSAGVSAEWTAEAAEMTDASPTLSRPEITPVRADAYVQASWELLEDSNLATDIAVLFADARDRLEGTAFAVGSGSTQPTGIVTALGLVTASRLDATTNAAFGSVDLFALDSALPARWRGNASWLAHPAYWNRVRQMATGTGPQHAFWTDLGGGVPPLLLGRPVYESSAMQSTLSAATASSDDCIVLGDFRAGYFIVDRVPMMTLSTPWIMGSNRRPTAETGFAAFWRTTGDTVVDDAFRMLRL